MIFVILCHGRCRDRRAGSPRRLVGVRRPPRAARLVPAAEAVMRIGRRIPVVVAAGALALVSGCVAPAPTTADYEAKAAMSADAAVSEVRTAVLAADTSLRNRMTAAYLET